MWRGRHEERMKKRGEPNLQSATGLQLNETVALGRLKRLKTADRAGFLPLGAECVSVHARTSSVCRFSKELRALYKSFPYMPPVTTHTHTLGHTIHWVGGKWRKYIRKEKEYRKSTHRHTQHTKFSTTAHEDAVVV